MFGRERKPIKAAVAAVLLSAAGAGPALAIDIPGVQPAAMDQPRINVLIRRTPDGAPLEYEGTFNVEAYYDTGASGILLSGDTADLLGINRSTWFNPATGTEEYVLFEDVGVAGSDQFNVSEQLHFSLTRYHPDINQSETDVDPAVYSHHVGPVRTQIGPVGGEPNPLLSGLDVVGTPAMVHKVVVMDPRPVNTFFDTMRTYVYEPNTPYNAALDGSDPGIPETTHHIKLSKVNFSRFTQTLPAGQEGPTLTDNPFIGWNPIDVMEGKPKDPSTPGIEITHNGLSSTGSWLLDSGAAASIVSRSQAEKVGITYVEGTYGSDFPVLAGVDPSEQFTLSIGGVGGTTKLAGFFLDSMLVRTQEGNAADPNDPNHIRFQRAPVLVGDITVMNPNNPSQVLTLDGIFGMNYLVASALMTEGIPFPTISDMTIGRFDWVVYDHDAGTLGLKPSDTSSTENRIGWFGSLWDVMNSDPSDWDVGASANFLTGMTLGVYGEGDPVLFGDNTLNPKVRITEPVAPGSVEINNSQQNYQFSGEAITGSGGLVKKGSGRVTFRNSNTYTGTTDIFGGVVVFAAPQDIGPVTVRSGAMLEMQTSQKLRGINVEGGRAVMSGSGNVLVTEGILASGEGVLDLGDNVAVVHTTAATSEQEVSRISGLIARARNEGTAGRWSGPGLTSSLLAADSEYALAAVINDRGDGTPLMVSFHGEAVDVNSILIELALYGDTDLNGVVDASDFQMIDRGMHENRSGWRYGDFDYSGTVDADDYFLIDRGYLAQFTAIRPTLANTAAVPEPTTAGLMALGAGLLLRRRRA